MKWENERKLRKKKERKRKVKREKKAERRKYVWNQRYNEADLLTREFERCYIQLLINGETQYYFDLNEQNQHYHTQLHYLNRVRGEINKIMVLLNLFNQDASQLFGYC